jgi:hypothetical protein
MAEKQKFISNYEEACAYLKRSTDRPDVSQYSEKKQRRLNADHDLETILEANNMIANGGKPWEANIADTTEEKWYTWHRIIPDESASGGFRLAFGASDCDDDLAYLGARHAAKTKGLSDFMGMECMDLYHDTKS